MPLLQQYNLHILKGVFHEDILNFHMMDPEYRALVTPRFITFNKFHYITHIAI